MNSREKYFKTSVTKKIKKKKRKREHYRVNRVFSILTKKTARLSGDWNDIVTG